MHAHGGKSLRENADVEACTGSRRRYGQAIRVEGYDGGIVGRKTSERVRVGGGGIQDARIGRCRLRHTERRTHHEARVSGDIGRDRELFLVEVQTVAPANHEPIVELPWAPGEADLRAEVILLRIPGVF